MSLCDYFLRWYGVFFFKTLASFLFWLKARENQEASDPQENYHILSCSPDIPVNGFTPRDSSDLNEESKLYIYI